MERLQSRVKSVINNCYFCKRYHCKPYTDPPTTTPDYRSTASRAFENVGVDFTGPFQYKAADGSSEKAYVVLYTCDRSDIAEVILNNRPLGYVENDIQLPVLTPSMIIHGTLRY